MGRKPDGSLAVAVLAGGESAEREVSLASGANVVVALQAAGHQPEQFDPNDISLEQIPWKCFDVCFLALHGGAGEDGRIQWELACRGVPYTGSGPEASWAAMSKSAAKERFRRAGVPTPPYVCLENGQADDLLLAQATLLGFPLVVKPDSEGSSLGVAVAHSPAEFLPHVAQTRLYGPLCLAERLVSGREFSVTVLGRRPLPVAEIVGRREIFDYQSKYESNQVHCRFESGLDTEVVETLQQTAVAAASALGCSGMVRADLMLDRMERPWVLEVNTLPGMTASSIAPKAAAQVGLAMPQLCDWMLRDALSRAQETMAQAMEDVGGHRCLGRIRFECFENRGCLRVEATRTRI